MKENFISRRAFFRKGKNTLLPILGALALSNFPVLKAATLKSVSMECKGNCFSKCEDNCTDSCFQICRETCYTSCDNTCKNACLSSCSIGCRTTCQGTCELSCIYISWNVGL